MQDKIKFIKTMDVKTPIRAHPTDSGIDFYIPNNTDYLIAPGDRVKINLGITIELSSNYDLQFVGKSGLADRDGLVILGGLIDNSYRGELQVIVYNTSDFGYTARGGEKIVQGVVRPVSLCELEEVSSLGKTVRGEGGFGSTGLT